jgi:hypothetical protein
MILLIYPYKQNKQQIQFKFPLTKLYDNNLGINKKGYNNMLIYIYKNNNNNVINCRYSLFLS